MHAAISVTIDYHEPDERRVYRLGSGMVGAAGRLHPFSPQHRLLGTPRWIRHAFWPIFITDRFGRTPPHGTY